MSTNNEIENISNHSKKEKVELSINNENSKKIESYEEELSKNNSYNDLNENFIFLKKEIKEFYENLYEINSIADDDSIIENFKNYIEDKYKSYNEYLKKTNSNIEYLNKELEKKDSVLTNLQNEIDTIGKKYKSPVSTSSMRKLGTKLESRYLELIEKVEVERENINSLNELYTKLQKNLTIIETKKFKKLFDIIYNKILSYYKTKLDKNTSSIIFNNIKNLSNRNLITTLNDYNNKIKLCIEYINKFIINVDTISNTYKVINSNTNNIINELRSKLEELSKKITIFIDEYKVRITDKVNKSFAQIKVLQNEVIQCINKFFNESRNNINSLGKLRINLTNLKNESTNLFSKNYVNQTTSKLSRLKNQNLEKMKEQLTKILESIIGNVNIKTSENKVLKRNTLSGSVTGNTSKTTPEKINTVTNLINKYKNKNPLTEENKENFKKNYNKLNESQKIRFQTLKENKNSNVSKLIKKLK